MAKQTFKITNWKAYNKALINQGSLTFWLDESAIQAWYDEPKTPSRGRPQRYSELAISTVLMFNRVFRLTLRAAQGFTDSIFTLMNLPLRCRIIPASAGGLSPSAEDDIKHLFDNVPVGTRMPFIVHPVKTTREQTWIQT